MRSIVYSQTGDPGVLTLHERPVPSPGPGQVLLRMHRSGVNPTDWKSRQGATPGTPVDPPQVPGQDGAGIVAAVGDGVQASLVGLRVWAWQAARSGPDGGTTQDYALVPERQVVPLPDSASFDLGASLGVPFVTAHRALTVREEGPTRLGPGALDEQVVLVTGGAGAVGNAAIQLARWSDARVIATVSSPRKALLAAAAGAHDVIDYRQQDVVAEVRKIAPAGVHAIVEVNAVANAAVDAALVAPNGSVAVYAGDPGQTVVVPARESMTANVRWQFVLIYGMPAVAKAQAVDDVAAAVAEGAVGVGDAVGLPLHHFPLEATADAHAAVEGGAVGKVIVDVAD